MKKPVYEILSCLCIAAFLVYWSIIFILVMPSNSVKKIISQHSPRFKNTFGIAWTLFTPPNTCNDRLYFVVRIINGHEKPDTIEVLENIALQKQAHAPFNQKENIIDHLVNNTVSNIKLMVWYNKKKPVVDMPGISDSLYIANAIAAVEGRQGYSAYPNTLTNYCRIILRQKKINTANKEIKIMITEKQIRPFKQMI
ncbi:hypothetical protein, partial [Ferruginibacter sp.]